METPGSSTSDYRAHERLASESGQFGGVKAGSAFLGWVTAMGMTVLLTALLTAFGAGVGRATDTVPGTAADTASSDPDAPAWISVLVLVLLLAYFCGGYVAARLARFNGLRQGVAVWLWAILATIVLAVLSALAQVQFDALGRLNGVPQLPQGGSMAAPGWIALATAVVVPLLGAILGGLAGMRHHVRVGKNSAEMRGEA